MKASPFSINCESFFIVFNPLGLRSVMNDNERLKSQNDVNNARAYLTTSQSESVLGI